MKIVAISLTKDGDKIIDVLDVDLFSYKSGSGIKIREIMEKEFDSSDCIIFITALGICVRSIAPFLKSKKTDPAIICISNDASYVISVAGGHLGGANEFAKKFAKKINATPIITTATDLKGVVAPDMIAKKYNLKITSMENCKKIASLLVDNKKVALIDDLGKIKEKGYVTFDKSCAGAVVIRNSFYKNYKVPIQLDLIRQNIVLGIGCKKDYDAEKMFQNVIETLKKIGKDIDSVCTIATINIKKNEKAIKSLGEKLNVPIKIFSIDDIQKVENKFDNSQFVKEKIGVGAVSEPCVFLTGAKLILKKQNLSGMTLSVGEL